MSRVAVVTGAASGMGLAIARRLAQAGNDVALLDLDGDGAAQGARELRDGGHAAMSAALDVSDRGEVDRALDTVRDALGPIAIMVTSAGFDRFQTFLDITVDEWERMLAVNLTGTFHCVQAAAPDMLAAGWGRVVTISSSSAQSGARRMAHYVASKGGVVGLTKALALELAPHGITVNTIPPGFIDTPMARRAEERGDLPSIDAVAKQTPVRRAGTPDDIAAACRVPLLRRRGLHHRAAHRRQRRLVLVTTPRLAPLPRSLWDGDVEAALRGAFPEEVADRFLSTGDGALAVPEAISTMLHHPDLAGSWLTFNNVLLYRGALDDRQRELMVLRVAWRTSSNYEWAQHVRLAPRAGITPEELDAIAGRRDDVPFTPLEQALLAATDELLASYRIGDATWNELARHLDERRLVEAVFVVGAYVCLAMAFKSFALRLDPTLDTSAMMLPEP